MKISATIITFNEEKQIKRCLDSLAGVVDEIVVVDSYSTDQTEDICRSFEQVRFIQNKFGGFIEQKNFAVGVAKYDWILSLDGDECLSEELIEELQQLKQADSDGSQAFSMPRLNRYCGRWIRHSGWYPDRKVRLWRKAVGKWGGRNPHDSVVLEKEMKAKMLKSDILHYTIPTLEAHVAQSNKFSEIAANELLKSPRRKPAVFKMIFNPPFVFFKKYFFQLGFLDGFHGLSIAVVSAHSKFLKYAKYIQLRSDNENSTP
jgi:glycosyltransferase involved in cell wall biosynthesis